jgi:hypothetical protein
MKHVILAIAAVAITGAANPPQRPNAPVMVAAIRADCPLVVSFGSYAMGIDSQAYSRIVGDLQYDRAVRGIEQHNWGREGERTLCVNVRKTSEARRVFNRIRKLFPSKPRGPLTVRLANGREFHAPQTRR